MEVQPVPDLRGSMQEQQASADSGEGSRQQRKKQRTEDPNTAHTLMDPSLDALRTALAGVDIPATRVPVSSPLPQDTRQQPYAANLLDLQLRGEGAPDECRCGAGICSLLPVGIG